MVFSHRWRLNYIELCLRAKIPAQKMLSAVAVSALLLLLGVAVTVTGAAVASDALVLVPSPNVSHFLLPVPRHLHSAPPPFLEEVVRVVAEKEGWGSGAGVRVSAADAAGARIGSSWRYEFTVAVAKTRMAVKFMDDDVAWRRPGAAESVDFGPDLFTGDAGERMPLVLAGPMDLRLDGIGHDELLSLHLPHLTIPYKGLRRVLVGNGILIKIAGAEEVDLFHPYNAGPLVDGRVSQYLPPYHGSCHPVLSVKIIGSASLDAYKTPSTGSIIKTQFLSNDTLVLLPDKCYSHGRHTPPCLLCIISSRLTAAERALRNLLGERIFQNMSSNLERAKIRSAILAKFRIELERNIRESDRAWKKIAAWKSKPTVEREWYEIVASIENGRLKPVVIKKLKRPLVVVESTSWSDLMSNISFTQFASIVVPPEALTLDIKW